MNSAAATTIVLVRGCGVQKVHLKAFPDVDDKIECTINE